MSGTNDMKEIPRFYEGRELPPGYFDDTPGRDEPIHNNVDWKSFLKYVKKSGKRVVDVTWEELSQFLLNPSIQNTWYR